jgi:hypothetical protein
VAIEIVARRDWAEWCAGRGASWTKHVIQKIGPSNHQ